MPGKLAAARASREVSERSVMLPRRGGSAQSGLSPELEDASKAEAANNAYASIAGMRIPPNGSTGAGSSKQPDGTGSSQSVTFLVTSGQHAQPHGTPTVTAAGLVQPQPHPLTGSVGVLSPRAPSFVQTLDTALPPLTASGAVGSSGTLPPRSAGASGPGSGALPPRSPSNAPTAQSLTATLQPNSNNNLRSGPPTFTDPMSIASTEPGPSPSLRTGTACQLGAWVATASVSSQQRPQQQQQLGSVAPVGSVGGEPEALETISAFAEPAGAAPPAAGRAHAATADHIWVAVAPRERSVTGTASAAIPLRHSRLHTAVSATAAKTLPPPSGAPVGPGAGVSVSSRDGAPPRKSPQQLAAIECAPGSLGPTPSLAGSQVLDRAQLTGHASEAAVPLALAGADSITSQGPASSTGVWAATAGAMAGTSSVGGGATPVSSSMAFGRVRSQAVRRVGTGVVGGTGRTSFGAGSELFPEPPRTEEALPSAESSFTVRQTPSDMEDELQERARARRAMRTVTLGTMGVGMGSEGVSGEAEPEMGVGADAGGDRGSGPAPHAGEEGGRMVIRLNHQPGHHRRPPNRHSSMPTMRRDGVSSTSPGGGGGVIGPGGLRKSTLMRPPVSGGVLAEETVPEDGVLEDGATMEDNPSNTSLPGGLLGRGAEGPGVSGGGGRVPSDSPNTSQMSVTSSIFAPGPGSITQPRYQALQHGALVGGGGGAGAGAGGVPNGGGGASAAAAAAAAAASLALAPATPVSRLGISGGQVGPPPGALARLPADMFSPMLVGGSSGQRSFEEDMVGGGRQTPTLMLTTTGTAAGGAMGMLQSNPQLGCSSVGLAFAAGDRPSGRLLSGAHAQHTHTNNLAALHKAVEKLMLQDSGLYGKVQASMKGISSLAKETNRLEFTRDASGATVINQYVVVKTLGRGAFGKVKLCLNTLDGQLYAVKMINRAHLLRQLQKPSRPLRRRAPPPRNTSDTGLMAMNLHRTQTDGNLSISHTNAASNFGGAAQAAAPARASMDDASPLTAIMREIAVMKKVDHPHVVRLHEVIDPPGSSYLMMVMEYCEGGCVMETRSQTGLNPLGEDTAREYFRQACLGLDYLHYNNVIHGDLKPENMLVSGGGLLKIADFGSSRFMGGDPNDATKTSCTPAFQSPEEIGHMLVDPFAADLWALGCCLYCFVFGRLPFVGSCVVDIYRAILTRPHCFPEDTPCSPGLRDLLDRMLDKDPKKRPALRDIGQHEWVTAGGVLPQLRFLQSLQAGGPGGEAPPPVIHVTHAEQANAIDRFSLVSLIRARLKEKTCQPGEYLFKEGEEAHCVYMIMAGVVELTQHLRRPAVHTAATSAGCRTGGGSGNGGCASATAGAGADGGADVGSTDHDASFSVDLDESLTLDHPDGAHITEAMNIVDGKLHIDRQQAIELRRRMQQQLVGENAEYVVEVKGPGSVIGEMGLETAASATHRVSARARGPVTVVKLTEENFFKALLQMYGGGGGGCGGSTASTTITTSSVGDQQGAGAGGGAGAAGSGAGGAGSASGGGGARGGSGMAGISAQHMMVMQYLEDSGSYACFPAAPASTGGGAGAGGRFSMDAGAGPSYLAGRAGVYLPSQHHHALHHAQQQQQQQQHGLQHSPGAAAVAVAAAAAAAAKALPATPTADEAGGASTEAAAAAAGDGGGAPTTAAGDGGGAPTAAAAATSAAAAAAAEGPSGSCPAAGGSGGRSSSRRSLRSGDAGSGPSRMSAALLAAKTSGVNSMLGVLTTIHSINASRAGGTTSEEGVSDL